MPHSIRVVNQQATLLAYIDVFWLAAVFVALTMLLLVLLLLRSARPGAASVAH